MVKRLAPLLVSLLLLGFAAAGCGGDEKEGGGGNGKPAQEPSASGKLDPSDPAVRQAVANCKQKANAASKLSADVRSDLDKLCEKTVKGDEDAVRKASEEICVKIVRESAPAGPAREQALTACKQASRGTP